MLTDQQQNVIVANVDGWEFKDVPDGYSFSEPRHPIIVKRWVKGSRIERNCPDYGEDYGAMYSAEEHLTPEQQEVYCNLIGKDIVESCYPLTLIEAWNLRHAECKRLRECFIKAIGMWKE